jgi:predicted nucleic acid-binding protein
MKTAVVDTSALMRLYIPDGPVPRGLEVLFVEAEKDEAVIIVPELLLVELAQVLYKKWKQKLLTEEESEQLLKEIKELPLSITGHKDFIVEANRIAMSDDITVYDAMFLALSEYYAAVFITVDSKLQNTAKKRGLATEY